MFVISEKGRNDEFSFICEVGSGKLTQLEHYHLFSPYYRRASAWCRRREYQFYKQIVVLIQPGLEQTTL